MRLLWHHCTTAAVAAIAACFVFAVHAENLAARQDERCFEPSAIPHVRQDTVDREDRIQAPELYSRGQLRLKSQRRRLNLICGGRSIEQLDCPVPTDSTDSIKKIFANDTAGLRNHMVQVNIIMDEPCRQYRQQSKRKGKGRQQHHRRKQHRSKNMQSYKGYCVATGLFCGTKLYGCSFEQEALYKCNAVGQKSELISIDATACLGSIRQESWTLRSANSIFETLAEDKCIQQCACLAEGLFCGSTFAPECKFQGFFRCDSNGATPILVSDCREDGGCTINAGDDACSTDTCTCPSPGYAPVCGSQLPKDCRDVKFNAISWCPGGSGTRPQVMEICKPGTLCQPKPLPDGAICGSNTCNCTGNRAICSNTFPSECQLERNAIYNCTEEGTAELVVQCDATEVCVTTAGGSICAVPDCKCPGNGTVCGEVFPLSCRLKKTALFECVQGQDPILKKDCDPWACADSRVLFAEAVAIFEVLAVSDRCTDLCTCQGEV
ncbi:unnamed protein product [Mortierella alpina]